MTVAVVTDSGSDLTPAQLAEHEIRQIPLTVFFGEQGFLSPDELPPDEFWGRMTGPESPFPHTAAPAAGQFKEVYEGLFAEGADAIVSVHLSETLSSTIQSARMAAEMLPAREIRVVDSRSASLGVGALALRAARMAAAGTGAPEIAAELERMRGRTVFFVALETLEYLYRGGRIGRARALVGGLLSVKPIMTIDEGIVVQADLPRTRARARERIIEFMTERQLDELHVLYIPPFDAEAFRADLLARLPGRAPAIVTTQVIGPVIGAHVGPGSYGGVLVLAQ